MPTILFGLIAAALGVGFATQPVLNHEITRSTGSPIWAALVSITISLLTLGLVAMTGLAGRFPADRLLGLPPWVALGGVFGGFIVLGSVWLTPIIGSAAFFAWLIAGQLAGSLVLDHIGFLGLAEAPITPLRVVGVVLAVGGAVLVKYG